MVSLPPRATAAFSWPPIPLASSAAAADCWLVTAREECPMRKAKTTANLRNYPARGSSRRFLTHFLQLIRGTRTGALLLPCLAVGRYLYPGSLRAVWLLVRISGHWRQVSLHVDASFRCQHLLFSYSFPFLFFSSLHSSPLLCS